MGPTRAINAWCKHLLTKRANLCRRCNGLNTGPIPNIKPLKRTGIDAQRCTSFAKLINMSDASAYHRLVRCACTDDSHCAWQALYFGQTVAVRGSVDKQPCTRVVLHSCWAYVCVCACVCVYLSGDR